MIANYIKSNKKITSYDMMTISKDYLDTFAIKFLPLLLHQLALISND